MAAGDFSHSGGASSNALAESTFAHGRHVNAGVNVFQITAFDSDNKQYTLSSVKGLAVNDVFTLLSEYGSYYNYGKITAIDTTNKKITVNNYMTQFSELCYLCILEKRYIGNTTYGVYSHAEGQGSIAANISSHAEGSFSNAIGTNSHAEGNDTAASGADSHAEGSTTRASGSQSHAEGYRTIASGNYSHAEGYDTTASNANSHAEGRGTKASDVCSHAEGNDSIASGYISHAEGQSTEASGSYSHTEGFNTTASGSYSHSGGMQSKAYASSSFTHGKQTIAGLKCFNTTNSNKSNKTYTLGSVTGLAVNDMFTLISKDGYRKDYGKITAIDTTNKKITVDNYLDLSGTYYIAILSKPTIGNTTIGESAFAEGDNTKALGDTGSHAEGSNTVAIGAYSHAEGSATTAGGMGSHAEGEGVVASGSYSHAEGFNTTASSFCQHVQGKNNIPDTDGKYAHIVGNGELGGTSSNAHTLDWSGNAWFAGDIKIGGTSYDDAAAKTIATTDYVNNKVNNNCIVISYDANIVKTIDLQITNNMIVVYDYNGSHPNAVMYGDDIIGAKNSSNEYSLTISGSMGAGSGYPNITFNIENNTLTIKSGDRAGHVTITYAPSYTHLTAN